MSCVASSWSLREQPLVIADVRVQGRLVAQEHVEEPQLRDVFPQDHQADRQRAGQDQPDRSPQKGPEGGSHQQGHFRDADALAEQPRLHDVIGEHFEDYDQPKNQEWLHPPRGIQPGSALLAPPT